MFWFIVGIFGFVCGSLGVILLILSMFHIFLDTFFPIDDIEGEDENV